MGISISLLGIAIILTSAISPVTFGLGLSFVGFIVSFVLCFIDEAKKVKDFWR